MGRVDRCIPRQEFVDAVDGVISDAFEDVVKIELWIEAVELG